MKAGRWASSTFMTACGRVWPDAMDTVRSGTSSGISNSKAAGQVTDQARRMARAGGGYSHFVKFMKVVLPLLAFGIIGLLAAWPRIQGDQSGTRRDSGELEMMRALYV